MSYGGSGGGGSLHTDSDVAFSNLADGQVLTYSAGLAKWQNQTPASGGGSGSTPRQGGPILAGDLYVGNNVMAPGYYIQAAGTLSDLYAYIGTAPTGSGATVRFNINGSSIATVTIAAGTTTVHASGLSIAVAANSIMTWDITAIGSGAAGSDLGVAWTGAA